MFFFPFSCPVVHSNIPQKNQLNKSKLVTQGSLLSSFFNIQLTRLSQQTPDITNIPRQLVHLYKNSGHTTCNYHTHTHPIPRNFAHSQFRMSTSLENSSINRITTNVDTTLILRSSLGKTKERQYPNHISTDDWSRIHHTSLSISTHIPRVINSTNRNLNA